MKRPALVKVIFAELRAAFGPDVATGDLAKLASTIVRSYTEDADELAQFGVARESRSNSSLAVDEAMEHGWRIVMAEETTFSGFDEMDIHTLGLLRPLIEKHLGPEWRQQSLTGQF